MVMPLPDYPTSPDEAKALEKAKKEVAWAAMENRFQEREQSPGIIGWLTNAALNQVSPSMSPQGELYARAANSALAPRAFDAYGQTEKGRQGVDDAERSMGPFGATGSAVLMSALAQAPNAAISLGPPMVQAAGRSAESVWDSYLQNTIAKRTGLSPQEVAGLRGGELTIAGRGPGGRLFDARGEPSSNANIGSASSEAERSRLVDEYAKRELEAIRARRSTASRLSDQLKAEEPTVEEQADASTIGAGFNDQGFATMKPLPRRLRRENPASGETRR
jgi:hypothetical protein